MTALGIEEDRPMWSDQLVDILRRPLKGNRRYEAEKALSCSVCWPAGGPARAVADSIAQGGPPPMAPGDSLLVSTSDTEQRSALWLLRADSPSIGEPPLDSVAAQSLEDAKARAFYDLPRLFAPLRGALPKFTPRRLSGGSTDLVLEGASYGLAMYLAVMSYLLGRPVPPHIAALAALASDADRIANGRNPGSQLANVDGLGTKLGRIVGSALAVTTVLVHDEQLEEAKNALERLGSSLEVVPISRRADALDVVWPDQESSIPAQWRVPDLLSEMVGKYFDAVINSRSDQPWRAVAGTLASMGRTGLLDDAPPLVQEQWVYALRIAQRHAGSPASEVALPTPSAALLDALGAMRAEALHAHIVQAAADANSSTLEQIITAARPSSWAPTESQVKLAGAIGRAWASVRDYARARVELARAVEAWFAWWREDDSTIALSELTRVLGVQKDGAGLLALSSKWDAVLGHSRSTPTSKAFLSMAIGRAFVQAGRPDEALRWLAEDAADWGHARPTLQRRRWRWLARAHDALGNAAEAMSLRALLADEQDVAFWLSALDARLAPGGSGEVDDALAALAALEPQAMRALLAVQGSAQERARVLVEEYAY